MSQPGSNVVAANDVSLRSNAAFLRVWISWTVSSAGDQVSFVALPLVAVLTLDATPFDMGLLSAAGTAPFLLFGLLAGVWIDRHRRKPVLVFGDLGRGLLLLTIPIAWLLDVITIYQLLVVAFLAGTLNLFFSVASLSVLPSIVQRSRLTDANSKLESSQAIVSVAMPAPAGFLVQLLNAPLVIGMDALSFLVSGVIVSRAKIPESGPARSPGAGRRRVVGEVAEGLQSIFSQPLIRPVVLSSAIFVLFGGAQYAIYILFLVEEFDLSAGWIGGLFALGGGAGVAGAAASERIGARIGVGRTLAGAMSIRVLSLFVPPLVAGGFALPFLALSHALVGFGTPIWNINQVSLRQSLTPDRLLGRMNATVRFVVWSMMPLGALGGGLLGSLVGLRPAMMVGAVGGMVAVLLVATSPAARLVTIPIFDEESPGDDDQTI